jgi:hypothetical protein
MKLDGPGPDRLLNVCSMHPTLDFDFNGRLNRYAFHSDALNRHLSMFISNTGSRRAGR